MPRARVRDEQIVVRVNDPVIRWEFSTDTDAPDGLPIRFSGPLPAPNHGCVLLSDLMMTATRKGGPVDDGATRAVFYADRAGDYLVDLTVMTDSTPCAGPAPTSCTRSCVRPLRYSCRDALGYTRGR